MILQDLEAAMPRVRRSRVDEFTAELDLVTRAILVTWQRGASLPVNVGGGTWEPLPKPLGDLRGRIIGDCMHRRTRARFEYCLARGDSTWTYGHGPWVTARQMALLAGVDEASAENLRKVMWLFYRNRWALEFADGCGWGIGGYTPLIAAMLAEPQRTRARWDLLISTGGLRWPTDEGHLHDVAGEPIEDDFYASP